MEEANYIEPWHLSRVEYERGLWLHGTQKEFESFSDERENSTCIGHFLTQEQEVAEYYAFGRRMGKVLPVHVRAPRRTLLDLREPEVFRSVMEESWLDGADFDELWEAHEAGELYNRSMGKDQKALLHQAVSMGARGVLLWDRTSRVVDTSLAVFAAEDLLIAPDHRHAVEQAMREGREVPSRVLQEYPDLSPGLKPRLGM